MAPLFFLVRPPRRRRRRPNAPAVPKALDIAWRLRWSAYAPKSRSMPGSTPPRSGPTLTWGLPHPPIAGYCCARPPCVPVCWPSPCLPCPLLARSRFPVPHNAGWRQLRATLSRHAAAAGYFRQLRQLWSRRRAMVKLLAARQAMLYERRQVADKLRRKIACSNAREEFRAGWAPVVVPSWEGRPFPPNEAGAAAAPAWLLHQLLAATPKYEPRGVVARRGSGCYSPQCLGGMYHAHRALAMRWEPVGALPEGLLEWARLRRVVVGEDRALGEASLGVYRLTLPDEAASRLNSALGEAAGAHRHEAPQPPHPEPRTLLQPPRARGQPTS